MIKYEVVCLVCYTCILGRTTSKREANLIAVGHMNAYGHQTCIQVQTKKESSNGQSA